MAAKFGLFDDEDHSKLPTLYWLPKLHERPYKSRFIANYSACTTTELSVLLTSCLTTYEHNRLDEAAIVDRHRCHMAGMFGLFDDEDHSKLPTLYWLPKPHERPYKSRFIANYSACITIVYSCDFLFCLFVLLLYVPSQQLWSLRDGQFT